MKKFLGLIFYIAGGGAFYCGYAFRLPGGRGDAALPGVDLLEGFVSSVLDTIGFDLGSLLAVASSGALYPFIIIGAIFVVIAILLTRGGDFESEEEDEKSAKKTPTDFYENPNNLVVLSQQKLDEAKKIEIVLKLRPQLIPHVGLFKDGALDKAVKQILSFSILALKRKERGIAADQFRAQDERMNHFEQETFARRFLPHNTSSLPKEAKVHVGYVYTLSKQAELQQTYLTQSFDWQDVSLRNAEEVFSIIHHGDEGKK